MIGIWRGLPTQAQAGLGAVTLLAVGGWGLYGITHAELDRSRGSGQALIGQVSELRSTLGREREKHGDLADLERRYRILEDELANVTSRLNRRLQELDERERELVDIERAVLAAGGELSSVETALTDGRARLNDRLALLGEREEQLAVAERRLTRVLYRRDLVQRDLEELEGLTDDRKRELVTAEQQLAELKREANDNQLDLAASKIELKQTREALSGIEERIGKARAMEAIDSLKAEQAGLSEKVAALDREITREKAFVSYAFGLGGKPAGLESELTSLEQFLRERYDPALARLNPALQTVAVGPAPQTVAVGETSDLVPETLEIEAFGGVSEAELAAIVTWIQQIVSKHREPVIFVDPVMPHGAIDPAGQRKRLMNEAGRVMDRVFDEIKQLVKVGSLSTEGVPGPRLRLRFELNEASRAVRPIAAGKYRASSLAHPPPRTPEPLRKPNSVAAQRAEVITADRRVPERIVGAEAPRQRSAKQDADHEGKVEWVQDGTIAITFAVNSSYFPPGTSEKLSSLIRGMGSDGRHRVQLQAGLSSSDQVAGATTPEEARRYNRWLAERRMNRIQKWLTENTQDTRFEVAPEFLSDDNSRRVVVRVALAPRPPALTQLSHF